MSNRVDLPLQAVTSLHAGNVIEAIKHVRETSGCGLKEAKDQVDAYLRAHPELQAQIYARSDGVKKFLSWLFMTAIAIAAIIYFWPR
jgi:hypothetical protein